MLFLGAAARPWREAQSTHELAYQVLHTHIWKLDAAYVIDLIRDRRVLHTHIWKLDAAHFLHDLFGERCCSP